MLSASASRRSSGFPALQGDEEEFSSGWNIEVDECLADAMMFGGLSDIFPGALPRLDACNGLLLPPKKYSISSSRSLSLCSSQALSEAFSDFSIACPPDSGEPDSAENLEGIVTTPRSRGGSGSSAPDDGLLSPSSTMDGSPSAIRPEGKYPLCPQGRCAHRQHWTRLRTKRMYVFFFCRHCGLGWCCLKPSARRALAEKAAAGFV
eukprot:TRINITY_DN2374_c0_g1_i1.p1 TRINITY_DN2374_c0_g1~~TRINITY_DN2374_c0_g1_i1.p1  ORF type:complete len:214 (+),score=9.31 TRINITY_DN2374_c0_g1_i1:25-642(+)